jgi:hypothetical protein
LEAMVVQALDTVYPFKLPLVQSRSITISINLLSRSHPQLRPIVIKIMPACNSNSHLAITALSMIKMVLKYQALRNRIDIVANSKLIIVKINLKAAKVVISKRATSRKSVFLIML